MTSISNTPTTALPPGYNPRRLDVAAFAQAGARISESTPLTELERLQATASQRGACTWQLQGHWRGSANLPKTPWLHLIASATLTMRCQRCLEPLPVALELERWFRFTADEASAAQQDAEADEDVLALEPELDLLALLEDELMLASPLAPRHAQCELPASKARILDDSFKRPNPFAALAELKPSATKPNHKPSSGD